MPFGSWKWRAIEVEYLGGGSPPPRSLCLRQFACLSELENTPYNISDITEFSAFVVFMLLSSDTSAEQSSPLASSEVGGY